MNKVLTHEEFMEQELRDDVAEHQEFWKKKLKSLVARGFEEKKLFVEIKIHDIKRRIIRVKVSYEIAQFFKNYKKIPRKIENISRIIDGIQHFKKIKGGAAYIEIGNENENKQGLIVTKQELGLAYISAILSAFFQKIDRKLQKKEPEIKRLAASSQKQESELVASTKKFIQREIHDDISPLIPFQHSFYIYHKDDEYFAVITIKKSFTLRKNGLIGTAIVENDVSHMCDVLSKYAKIHVSCTLSNGVHRTQITFPSPKIKAHSKNPLEIINNLMEEVLVVTNLLSK